MAAEKPSTTLRYSDDPTDLGLLGPLWNALQEHHGSVLPKLGPDTPPRATAEAWERRRAKYERWLEEPETFFVLAEHGGRPVGYAFVTVGTGFAGWATGRLANLETLSVLPSHRRLEIGAKLLEAVWARLAEGRVREMVITTAISNVDSHRFYERHGFEQAFVVYYGKRDD